MKQMERTYGIGSRWHKSKARRSAMTTIHKWGRKEDMRHSKVPSFGRGKITYAIPMGNKGITHLL